MSSSIKLKVVAVGHRSVKNIFFRNCNQISKAFSESSLMTLGVSIKIGCYSNDDNLTMSIWDISRRQRFRAFCNTFFRGAAAFLLFYEISDKQTYSEIEEWINLIRTFTAFIPIFLIVYKSDLKIKIGFGDIVKLVEEHQIESFYLLSVRKRIRSSNIFNNISQKILENIGTESSIKKHKNTLSTEELEIYWKFINFFSSCPICGKLNQLYNLNRIYFLSTPHQKKFKESLLNLMKQSENYDNLYINRIKVGIPCCSCHQKFFS